MRVDSAVVDYFLKAKKTEILYDTLEISHSAFSQVFYLVRNSRFGLTAGGVDYTYCPMGLRRAGSSANLEQMMELTIGDMGKILYPEYIRAVKADGMREKPVCIYRGFRSTNLSEPIYYAELAINDAVLVRNGAQFTIAAPTTNTTGTGEVYSIQRFPMLRAYMK